MGTRRITLRLSLLPDLLQFGGTGLFDDRWVERDSVRFEKTPYSFHNVAKAMRRGVRHQESLALWLFRNVEERDMFCFPILKQGTAVLAWSEWVTRDMHVRRANLRLDLHVAKRRTTFEYLWVDQDSEL